VAREGKRKRDEKRFGKPERMIDKILADGFRLCPWSETPGYDTYLRRDEFVECARQGIALATSVVADNVSEYLDANPKNEWTYENDFPTPVCPWKHTFIEMLAPWQSARHRVGCYFYSIDSIEGMTPNRKFFCFTFVEREGVVFGPTSVNGCTLSEDGRKMENVKQSLMGFDRGPFNEASPEGFLGPVLVPAFLSLSFMNCKNVTINAIDPDPALNRERRKAGLQPFLRYHTINIEPMKQVLRTEGGVEANGIKKALHICRGHFATYTDEKPLFGHTTGTVWRPSHVRGSAKQGVVVADYKVNPPSNQ
jgi:hypothetical protein